MHDPVTIRKAWKPPPINIADLLALGQNLASPDTPAIEGLCVRLATHVAELHEGTDIGDVVRWAENSYAQWSSRLERHDSATMEATLGTDPGNLILGALALHDRSLVERSLRTQMELYEWSTTAGVPALSRLNQAIVRALLGTHLAVTAPHALCDPLTEIELAADLSPVAMVTLALGRRSTSMHEVIVTEEELTAVGLRSVWMRDLPGVGLSLLASMLLFGRPVPHGLIAWIQRITRSDGFFGMWQLYAEHHAKANLLATVNIYWGLSARGCQPSEETRPDVSPRAPNSATIRLRCREGIERAQSWIDTHDEHFQLLPACRDDKQYESRFKPLVELALLSYVLTRERYCAAKAPWVAWARSTAERLFAHVEWEGLIEGFRLHTSATLGLAIYPLLMEAAGRTSRFAAEAKFLLENAFAQAQERTAMREMDYQFTRHCMGTFISPEEVRNQIARTIMRLRFDPLLMDTDALYDLTHIVFYATRFGCAPWSPGREIENWLGESLNAMMLARFLMHDADLGAEFLLVHFYTGRPFGEFTLGCLERLLAAQTTDGAFRGPNQDLLEMDEFDSNYHTTLVAIAALAEADLQW